MAHVLAITDTRIPEYIHYKKVFSLKSQHPCWCWFVASFRLDEHHPSSSHQQSVNQAGSLCVNASSQSVDQQAQQGAARSMFWCLTETKPAGTLGPTGSPVSSTHLLLVPHPDEHLSWRNKWIPSPSGDQNHLEREEVKCVSRLTSVERTEKKRFSCAAALLTQINMTAHLVIKWYKWQYGYVQCWNHNKLRLF